MGINKLVVLGGILVRRRVGVGVVVEDKIVFFPFLYLPILMK